MADALAAADGEASVNPAGEIPSWRDARIDRQAAAGEAVEYPDDRDRMASRAEGSTTGNRLRPGVRYNNSWLSFRSPRLYLLGFAFFFVLFIGALVGINHAPPFSGLSYTMGWTIVLSILGAIVSLICFARIRTLIRREQAAIRARVDDLLKVFEKRQLSPTKEQHELVASSDDLLQLEQWFDRSLIATTADEVFKD
jgi:hypothetical protein